MGQITSLQKFVRERKRARKYDAANQNVLTQYWQTQPSLADFEIRDALQTLQTRARNEYQNNDYVKRFINMAKTNIVGHAGIKLQAKIKRVNGRPDLPARELIENAWRLWNRKGSPEVTRRFTGVDLQNLAVSGLLVDGELIVRHYTNYQGNAERYAVQFLDPRLLDITLEGESEVNGNQIIMGVERDKWGGPTAYYFRKQLATRMATETRQQDLDRVPAEDISHIFLPEFVTQTRGVPPIAVSLLRLNMLSGYEEAELVAARAGANKLGFVMRDAEAGGQYVGDDEDAEGNVIIDSEPGGWMELPPGYRAELSDPKHPTDAYDKFVMQILRGVASGLNVSYNGLANDLVGVSWSSLRKADLDERAAWRCLQQFVVDHLLEPMYLRWLSNALKNGALQINGNNLPRERFNKFANVSWQPRGWEWVDPVKQEQANLLKIQRNGISVSQLIREDGGDPDEVFAEIAEERQKMSELGIDINDVIANIETNGGNQDNADPE